MLRFAVRPTADATGGILISSINPLSVVPSALASFAGRLAVSFQPLCRLAHEAQIGVFLHVDRSLEESEVALHVDVGLQRR